MQFLYILVTISLNIAVKGSVDNKSSLVRFNGNLNDKRKIVDIA